MSCTDLSTHTSRVDESTDASYIDSYELYRLIYKLIYTSCIDSYKLHEQYSVILISWTAPNDIINWTATYDISWTAPNDIITWTATYDISWTAADNINYMNSC